MNLPDNSSNPFTVPAPVDTAPPAPATEYEFVRMPDGSIQAVAKSDIKDVAEIATATQNVSATPPAPKVEVHFYVWLADGSVIRVKEENLPGSAGANAPYGHWQRDNNVYQIVAVYPVEDVVKGSN